MNTQSETFDGLRALAHGLTATDRALLSLPLVSTGKRRRLCAERPDRGRPGAVTPRRCRSIHPPSQSGHGQKIARCPRCHIGQFALLIPHGHTQSGLHTETRLHHTLATEGIAARETQSRPVAGNAVASA